MLYEKQKALEIKKEQNLKNITVQPKYNYEGLLKPDLKLVDVIDAGENILFDCPPINFNQIDYS